VGGDRVLVRWSVAAAPLSGRCPPIRVVNQGADDECVPVVDAPDDPPPVDEDPVDDPPVTDPPVTDPFDQPFEPFSADPAEAETEEPVVETPTAALLTPDAGGGDRVQQRSGRPLALPSARRRRAASSACSCPRG